jgi:hypothetical protein
MAFLVVALAAGLALWVGFEWGVTHQMKRETALQRAAFEREKAAFTASAETRR